MSLSPAERLAQLPAEEREAVLGALSEEELENLLEDWEFHARPEQLEPRGAWWIWLVLAGRGFGKNRLLSEWVHKRVRQGFGRIALVARTSADLRDTVVEGESGILETAKRGENVTYTASRRRVTWEDTGAIATLYSAEEPDQLRGPQHDTAAGDEFATWQHIVDDSGATAFDNLLFGLRLGNDPRALVVSTPKPIPLVKDLLKREGRDVHVTRGTLYDNLANLAPTFVSEITGRYEGTRLGRQEIHGLVLEDVEGALWSQAVLDRDRRTNLDLPRDAHDLVVIGVDPMTGDPRKSVTSETGIVGIGRTRLLLPDLAGRVQRHLDVLADFSLTASPEKWAAEVVRAYRLLQADWVVAEKNQGGEMVRSTIANEDPSVPVELVSATRGKRTRAEPVAQLSEQGRFHVIGYLGELESQLTSWVPGDDSPDRLDACVWGATKLLEDLPVVSGGVHTGAGRRIRTGASVLTVRRRRERDLPEVSARRAWYGGGRGHERR